MTATVANWDDESTRRILCGHEEEFIAVAFEELAAKYKSVFPGAVVRRARMRRCDSQKRQRRFATCLSNMAAMSAGTKRCAGASVPRTLSEPESFAVQRECVTEVRAAVALLPTPIREVVYRCKILNESPASVAAALGCSIRTIHNRLRDGEAILRRMPRLASLES